jgi:2-polyprenyl-3-methyl-5-hydroxy-6-metoxy-1,4-benzoquinol methylase
MAINTDRLDALLGKAVVDFGATFHAALVGVGDRLGLYKALADGGAQTPAQLAKHTGTAERYVREWLCNQAAGGYVTYDSLTGRFQVALAAAKAQEQVTERFKTGKGMGWHEHDPDLFIGTERFFRPGYAANLISAWIPALEGVAEKLTRGATVADVGCGLGASTILMAKSYPNSRFFGFDYHSVSIGTAKKRAQDAGVADRIQFKVAKAKSYPGENYDFVTFFDCLHDMGDPVGAAAHVRKSLKSDGTWMIVEPFAGDKIEENLHPIGRAFYGASTLLCTPASLSQEVGLALGAQAGEKRLREVVSAAGFATFRRATQTPFNLVLEARP